MYRRHLVVPALIVLVSALGGAACSGSDDEASSQGGGGSPGQGGSASGASGQGGSGAKAGSGGKAGSSAQAGASGKGGAGGQGGSSGKGGSGASGSSGSSGQGGSSQGGQGQGGAGAEGGSAGQGVGGSGAEGGSAGQGQGGVSSGQGGAGGPVCPIGSMGTPSWNDTCAPCPGVPCSPGDTCHSAFHQGMPLDDYCACGPAGTMECTVCFPFPVCASSYPRCDGVPCGGGGTGGQGGEGGSSGQGGAGGAGSCLGSELLSGLGKSTVLVGAAMEDATAKAAPWDGRYHYLAGGVPDGSGPCASCASGCTSDGQSCDNSAGCGWWGCWQYDQDPPGAFVRDFVKKAKGDGQIPMITYYEILQASGVSEGMGEVDVANDLGFMKRYLADFRFLAQQIGSETAFIHIEPDFWGYTEHAGPDPHMTPAKVSQAAPEECGSLEDSIAGLGRCMIAIVRKHAPGARVGLHASGWGTKIDVLGNTDGGLDVAGEAKKLGAFLAECGAAEGDFIVADMSDRDAGFYQSMGKQTFWDDTNATLPNFTQAFAWSKALAEQLGRPVIWWQIPVGNMSLDNTTNHWKDNRVDYLLTHTAEVSASHGAGLFFGAGEGQQTTPESDGGNLVSRVKSLSNAGGQKYCGP